MKLRTVCLVSAMAFALVPTGSMALLFCTEPTRPYCLDAYGTFRDEHGFNTCKLAIEFYLRDVDEFINCLANAANEARDEANKVVEKFNCHASGNAVCY